MAINVVHGDTPGAGGLIANRLQSADQQAAQQKDMNYQQVQREADRQLQERMQKRQLKQDAIFRGISAATGLAGVAQGIPGMVEGFKNLLGPTERQQQTDFRSAQTTIQAAQSGAQMAATALAGERAASRVSASSTVGTSRMLSNVVSDADNELFKRIQSGDHDSLSEGLRTGKVAYSPSMMRQRRTWEDSLDKVQSDPNLTPMARKASIAQLTQALESTKFSVNPSGDSKQDMNARAQDAFGVNTDPLTGKKSRVTFDRNGVPKEYLTHDEKTQLEYEHKERYETNLLERKAANPYLQYDDAFATLAKANAANVNRDDPTPTHDEVMAYLERKNAGVNAIKALAAGPGAGTAQDSALPVAIGGVPAVGGVGGDSGAVAGIQSNPIGQPIAAMQPPQAPSPAPWKTVIQQGQLAESLPSPGVQPEQVPAPAPDKPQAPAANPLRPASTIKRTEPGPTIGGVTQKRIDELLPQPKSEEEYRNLPRGTVFLDPQGKRRKKP